MVMCVVIGCSKRSGRDKDVSFYRIPKIVTHRGKQEYELTKKRRAGFLAAISREGLEDSRVLEDNRICSRHFISGKPAYLYDEANPDWLPTLHLGHAKKRSKSSKDTTERWERNKARREAAKEMEVAQSLLLLGETEDTTEIETGVAVQTDLTSVDLFDIQKQPDDLQRIINDLTMRLTQRVTPFSEESLHSVEIVKFYTGLPNIKVLKTVFGFVNKAVHTNDTAKLSPFQEFMATIVKLRLNCPVQDLAYRLNVSCATVSRIFLKWMTAMDKCLYTLILWPDREALCKTMLECFRASFGTKVAVIIDCFEIFIERPSNLQARASTWSSYKHHNTVKILLGITPQGVVSFVSESWGGRVSDKHLTEHCGILDKLLPGDVVLAERGFDIKESVGMTHNTLLRITFTKEKSQLSAMEVTETSMIANIHIHVERVIGNVIQHYSVLQSTPLIDCVIKRDGEECPLTDQIVHECCALCSVCDSVVPFD